MTPDQSFQIQRRDLLRTVGAGALALGAPAVAAKGNISPSFAAEQGGTCYPVEPLGDGSQTIESFYDYGQDTGFSSAGTTDIQRPDTSLVFLYEGSEGLSLVFLHEAYQKGGDGGSASVTITGLPEPVDWAIQDDDYPAETSYDQWRESPGKREVDWTWAAERTDGGALRGLTGSFDVTIDMRFNEGAALFGKYYDGRVEEWQLLTGDASNPERIPLSMEKPLVIRTGTCDGKPTPGDGKDQTPGKHEVVVKVRPALQKAIINPRSNLSIPVGIYSSKTFDARTIDTSTIEFGPAGASPVRVATADLNADGRQDLLAFFDVQSLGLTKDTTRLRMTARTKDGGTVVGADDVEFFPPFEDDSDGKTEKAREKAEKEREKAEKEAEKAREKAKKEREKAEKEAEKAREKAEKAREEAEREAKKERAKKHDAQAGDSSVEIGEDGSIEIENGDDGVKIGEDGSIEIDQGDGGVKIDEDGGIDIDGDGDLDISKEGGVQLDGDDNED